MHLKILKPSGMTVEQLAETPEYSRLKPQQKAWVSRYIGHLIATGILDVAHATRGVYHCGLDANNRTLGYQVRDAKRVQAVLKVYWNFGRSERDFAIDELERQIAAAPPGSNSMALLMSQRNSLKFGPQMPGSHLPKVPAQDPIARDPRVPPDATEVWRDKVTGALLGYRASNGEAVKIS